MVAASALSDIQWEDAIATNGRKGSVTRSSIHHTTTHQTRSLWATVRTRGNTHSHTRKLADIDKQTRGRTHRHSGWQERVDEHLTFN